MTNQIIDQQLSYRANLQPTVRLNPVGEKSLLQSLREQIRDVLFPEKQMPLRVTSRPVAVRDIWEKRKTGRAATLSLMVHGVLIAGVIAAVAFQPKVRLAESIKEKY